MGNQRKQRERWAGLVWNVENVSIIRGTRWALPLHMSMSSIGAANCLPSPWVQLSLELEDFAGMDEYSIRYWAGLVLWAVTPVKTGLWSWVCLTAMEDLTFLLPTLQSQAWGRSEPSCPADAQSMGRGNSLPVNYTRIYNSLWEVHSLLV